MEVAQLRSDPTWSRGLKLQRKLFVPHISYFHCTNVLPSDLDLRPCEWVNSPWLGFGGKKNRSGLQMSWLSVLLWVKDGPLPHGNFTQERSRKLTEGEEPSVAELQAVCLVISFVHREEWPEVICMDDWATASQLAGWPGVGRKKVRAFDRRRPGEEPFGWISRHEGKVCGSLWLVLLLIRKYLLQMETEHLKQAQWALARYLLNESIPNACGF